MATDERQWRLLALHRLQSPFENYITFSTYIYILYCTYRRIAIITVLTKHTKIHKTRHFPPRLYTVHASQHRHYKRVTHYCVRVKPENILFSIYSSVKYLKRLSNKFLHYSETTDYNHITYGKPYIIII